MEVTVSMTMFLYIAFGFAVLAILGYGMWFVWRAMDGDDC